ncbi:unnamed protein product [Acanthoscelides obtectus]|uniref:Sugar transporter SWEET1 n=2 Tax=Acanthoscelides obtectus TaxID=200917 RepID=A0A9P0PC17_ACAOB|nr:unnamed protein product [Acanthoscelides obtectus]CAK1658314.1 Sugar transporter SWEET1 [Acanthoscelides obtectus]
MSYIIDALEPYTDVVAQVASIVTIAHMFTGVLLCRDIYNKKSTQGTPAMPFIGGIAMGAMVLKHGLILNDTAMLQVNTVGIILNLAYIGVYYHYSKDKYNEVLRPLGIAVAIVSVVIGYAHVESADKVEFRYGMVVTILMLMLLGAPLLDVRNIIEKKDASSIIFSLTVMAALVTFLWLLYGLVIKNAFIIFQNGVGFTLCSIQLFLLFLYGKPADHSD